MSDDEGTNGAMRRLLRASMTEKQVALGTEWVRLGRQRDAIRAPLDLESGLDAKERADLETEWRVIEARWLEATWALGPVFTDVFPGPEDEI